MDLNEKSFLDEFCEEVGCAKTECRFYKLLINTGIVDNLSDEDYEIWKDNDLQFLKTIIIEDEVFWDMQDILSTRILQLIDEFKNLSINTKEETVMENINIYTGIYMRDNEIYHVNSGMDKEAVIKEIRDLVDEIYTEGLDYAYVFLNNQTIWNSEDND